MANWSLPATRVRSGATNIVHSTNFNSWSTAASIQLTAYMTHLHLGISLLLLQTLSSLSTTPPTPCHLTYTAADLHRLNNNNYDRVPAATATAASKARILRHRRFIHQGSGPSCNPMAHLSPHSGLTLAPPSPPLVVLPNSTTSAPPPLLLHPPRTAELSLPFQ